MAINQNLNPSGLEALAADCGATLAWDGTGAVLYRNGWGLSWAGERQTLPSGSTPLGMGHEAITGQGWMDHEVRAFARVTNAFIVYEFETSV